LITILQHYLVAMATSLDKLENYVQVHHLHVKCFHMVKRFRKSVQYIWRYLTKMCQFLPCLSWRLQMSKINSGVTGPNFVKFSHNIETSFTLLTHTLRWRYPILFWNGRVISAGVGNFATTLPQNWLPWQRPLRNPKKWTGLTTFTQIPSIWWKIRENRSSRSCDSYAQFKKDRNYGR